MKSIRYFLLALILCLPLTMTAPEAELAVDEFTHTVFAEEFTATWCVYCPSAAENLMKIYEDVPDEPYYHDKFFFVALITDVNDKADDRMGDYPDVTGYPTVVFDGNDEKVSGGQDDTSNYEQAIDNCGQREDTDISLDIQMEHAGEDKLSVNVLMTWNEDASISDTTLNGYVRAYIVEKVSRYNNYDGNPYHFGFLDYAFDESVELEPHQEKELTTVWVGGEHEDANGNDFSDIEYENINIFVAFFNDESASTDKYVLETASAIPPELTVEDLDEIVGGEVEIQGSAISEKSEIKEIKYRWNQENWKNTGLESLNGDFYFRLDSTEVSNGEHELSIMAIDNGASVHKTLTINVLNDENPPSIHIISPEEEQTLEEIAVIELEAIDDNQISNVEFQINDGNWRKMYYNNEDRYLASWNTQEANAGNGNHLINFRVSDSSLNWAYDSVNITVFNEEDITYPYLNIITPIESFYHTNIEIIIETDDPDGIETVEYWIDEGTTRNLVLENSNEYRGLWTPPLFMDGWHTLHVRSIDKQEYETELDVNFEIDGTPPQIVINKENNDISGIAEFRVDVDDYSKLESARYRIDGGQWIELDKNDRALLFNIDSTKYNDGECLLEIECTDKWNMNTRTQYPLDIKNTGLIHSAAPAKVEAGNTVTVSSVIDYENPVKVSIIIAKTTEEEGILSEGQRLDMFLDGNYYYADIYFEEAGSYVYSVEIDTGNGKIKDDEQIIFVSEKQEIVNVDESNKLLFGLNFLATLCLIIIVAVRKKN